MQYWNDTYTSRHDVIIKGIGLAALAWLPTPTRAATLDSTTTFPDQLQEPTP
ncbi:MAG: hypothetical protein ABW106_00520 [Steroidobacteraceae bacterium]